MDLDDVLIGGVWLTLFLIIFGGGIIGMFAWPFVINSWLVYFGKAATVAWWHGFLLGMVPYFGWLSLPATAATWIIMLFL